MRTRLLRVRISSSMGYALAPNVHACAADGTVFFLDVGRDRYCKAGPAASRALLAHPGAEATPETMEPMVDAGLLTYRAGAADLVDLCSHSSPSRDLHPHFSARPPVRLSDVVEVAALAMQAACRLRRRGFAHTLFEAKAHGRATERPITINQLATETARFQCARSVLPASPRCLMDSLLLKGWMARRGISTSLVIGIRPLPFAAHCWVEHDGIVLNGSQDGIANFVPICVL